ncbi:lipoate--protein ligase [Halosquirtibacter laminarini]|uniref:Lipoate--protein ligase n=1 Tax=Halosquirtibacter laminarini TaxID=3374600 RepID=A0AC61NEG0_9BACT|nr:lipoate--protein ligase [Prolixibacteraceae bacterium]
MLKIICSNTTNPFFNIATEEFLLKNKDEDFLFLYINEDSAIIGKHQNAFEEVSSEYIKSQRIPVLRRISGGGTVVHDMGNINFSFIRKLENIETLSYKQCIEPLQHFLAETYCVDAHLSERNDIQVDGKKVTGTAFHIYKDRIIAHGTLLINSNLSKISKILNAPSSLFQSKGVKSKRSRIMNLGGYKNIPTKLEVVTLDLIHYFEKKGGIYYDIESEINKESIEKLIKQKYNKWEWNIGYGPKFKFLKSLDNTNKTVMFHVEKGYITDSNILSEKLIEKKIPFKQGELAIELHKENSFEVVSIIEKYLL